MARIIEHWWANILGFHRLNADAYKYLSEADRSKALAVTGGNDAAHLSAIAGKHENDTGRVAVANHRPSYWNGAWDYSTGTDPNKYLAGGLND